MEITYSEKFYKSLKKLMWEQSLIYRFYALFRYDIPRFFKNIWLFRKPLWQFHWFDYSYNLRLFKRSLEITCDNFEKYGYELEENKNLRIQKMRRVIELLDNHINDNYSERIKKKYNIEELENLTSEQLEEIIELENKEWEEIWEIISITESYKKFYELIKNKNPEERKKIKWEDYFDGSCMRGWWD